jgi:UPF0271 protein
MAAAAELAGTSIRFVKPHGALYNRAATDATVAEPVVRAAAALGLPVLCPPGSAMERVAPRFGVTVFREAFADRGYRPDGRLVGREAAGALIADPDRAAARAVVLVERGLVEAIDGSKISVAAESICIHGDTPGALELARAVRRALEAAGISIRPFAADPP